MSLQNIRRIVDKAIEDELFRRVLLDNPETATQGIELSDSELAMLKTLSGGPFASRRGLVDVGKMVQASIEYEPPTENSSSAGRVEESEQKEMSQTY